MYGNDVTVPMASTDWPAAWTKGWDCFDPALPRKAKCWKQSSTPPKKKLTRTTFAILMNLIKVICLKENEGAHSFMPIPIPSCTYEFSVLCFKTSLNSSSSWLTGLNTETKVMTPEREIAPYEVPRPSLLPQALEKTTCGSKSWFPPLFFQMK